MVSSDSCVSVLFYVIYSSPYSLFSFKEDVYSTSVVCNAYALFHFPVVMLQTVKHDIIAFVFCGLDLLLLSGRWLWRRVRRNIGITDKPEPFVSKATEVATIIWQEELNSHGLHEALD